MTPSSSGGRSQTSVPADAEVTRFERAITDAGVQLTGLNFNAGDMPGGDRGLVSWTGRCAEFQDNIDVVAGIGERLGCTAFNALYGNRHGRRKPRRRRTSWRSENLAAAAAGVARIGGTVLLEPVSGAPRYPLLTAEDALRVIARVKEETGAENIKLLADFYHLSVNGDDVAAVIEKHAKDFGHIQIADNPGRGAPGTGELPLGEWIARSRELGYEGYIGLEYKEPRRPPSAGPSASAWPANATRTRHAAHPR